MPTNLTRFEVVLPSVNTGSTDDTAIHTFRHNMETLTKLFMSTSYLFDVQDNISQRNTLYGYITTAQQATALGYLNTLNASLTPANSPVDCEVWNATSEP